MFPVGFARAVIEEFCPKAGGVLDPFCGRGTAPFVAKALGRRAMGVDLNPVAWLYSVVKTAPFQTVSVINMRISDIARAVRTHDKEPVTEFQSLAWSREVLGFLNAARRLLNWRERSLDQTIMGFILVYLHAKEGGGLSNCMRQSKAMAPDYSVRWWRSHGKLPPDVDAAEFLKQRIEWRYKYGVVQGPDVSLHLGDARRVLNHNPFREKFDLLLTSPPYYDITNYRYDNWIRLWMLGGAPHPDYRTDERYGNRPVYEQMLRDVLTAAAHNLKRDATIYIRTDARPYTAEETEKAVRLVWPDHRVMVLRNRPRRRTQTALFGDMQPKPGDLDIIATLS
jgi:hypothetical protein